MTYLKQLTILMAVVLAVFGCDPVKLEPQPIPTANDLKNALAIEDIPYIRDDTFIGNPEALLGQVVEIRKRGQVCPERIYEGDVRFSVIPFSGFEIDNASRLSAPFKRDSKIVDKGLAAQVSLLNYLSAELDEKSVFSIILFDQAGARVNATSNTWQTAVNAWSTANRNLFNDPNICYLWVIKGFIQKNIIRKKFREVNAGGIGSAYGVKVGSKYYSSNEDYSVDVKFGLSPGIMRSPTTGMTFAVHALPIVHISEPTDQERNIFSQIKTIQHRIQQ